MAPNKASFLLGTSLLAAMISAGMAGAQDYTQSGSTNYTRSDIASLDTMATPTYSDATPLGVEVGDNLGDHVATQDLNMDGSVIFNTGDLVDPMDGVNKRYVDTEILAGRDNLGNHQATQALEMDGYQVFGL